MSSQSSLYYWDTSALLTLLFEEKATSSLREFVENKNSLPGYTSFFTFVEFESAVFRRLSERSLTIEISELRLQLKQLEQQLALIWPDFKILDRARRSISEWGLRPGDAIQLASALELAEEKENVSFVSLDKKLSISAAGSGLMLFSK